LGIAIVFLCGPFEDRVGERRDVRVNAPQVTGNAQKVGVVESDGNRVRSGRHPWCRPHVQSRRFSFQTTQLPLARDEPPRAR
jgi:hypothetical protein